jgi:hypothetical protein
MTAVTALIAFGCTGAFIILIMIIVLSRRKWDGTPARDLPHAKCTRCRGGVQVLQAGRGWCKIPDELLLLNRRPDSDGGDKWGSPQANVRDCPCCNGLSVHVVTDPAGWACPLDSSEVQ